MRRSRYEKYLTTAAKTELKRVLASIREALINDAYQNAVAQKPLSQKIDAKDIQFQTSKYKFLPERKSPFVRTAVKFYQVFGVLIAILGLSFFLMDYYNISLSSDQLQYLALAGMGLILFFSSYLFDYAEKSKKRQVRGLDYSYEFLREWKKVETLIRETSKDKTSIARTPYSTLLNDLVNSDRIGLGEQKMFKELLTIRNRIVHEDLFLSKNEFDNLYARLKSLRNIIETNIKAG